MLKTIILSLFFLLFSQEPFSQVLSGQWEGQYTLDATFKIPIFLEFKWNIDSTYTVNSYSVVNFKGKDTIAVCWVKMVMKNKHSIYLEEKEVISPIGFTTTGMQKMFLEIKQKKKKIILQGRWEDAIDSTNSGSISFWKKE